MTKLFYKVMLSKKSDLAEKCGTEGFIGTDFDVREDLTGQLDKAPVARRLVRIKADVRYFVPDRSRVSCRLVPSTY